MDTYGLREALESAALTASNIAYRVSLNCLELYLTNRIAHDHCL